MAVARSVAWPPNSSVREYVHHRKKVHCISWNETGHKLASGSIDQSARVWTIDTTGRAVDVELKGHSDSIDQLRWDPTNPENLATASADRTVRIWDARSAKCAHAVETVGGNINIAWSPDGNHIAVGDKEDNISIIDTRKCKIIQSWKFTHEVNELAWDRKGRFLFLSTGPDGFVKVFNYSELLQAPGKVQPTQKLSIRGHTASCYCIDFDRSGKYLAVGGADALVSLWSLPEMVCVRTFSRLEFMIRTVSFSHDSAFIASASSQDNFIDITEVGTGKQVHSIPCSEAMNSLSWHPSRYLLAYAGDHKDKLYRDRDEGSLRIYGYSAYTEF